MKRIWKPEYALAAAVALITFILYLPALQNGFINWDDGPYVVENTHIRSFDPAFLRWIFFDFHAAYWHPLTWISHALDYAIWGLDPFGHHLTSNILHSINSGLVVVLVTALLNIGGRRAAAAERKGFLPPRTILVTGGVTGLLFGLHPLHVESAVWVAERKDLLCALFFLLTLLFYAKYADNKGGTAGGMPWFSPFADRHYRYAVFFFMLAIFSKPMAVSLPVVLLLIDWHLFRSIRPFRSFLSAVAEKIPFIALSLFISLVIVAAHKEAGAVVTLSGVPVPVRLLVAARSLIAYLWMMIWPAKLFPYYPHPLQVSLLSWQYASAAALVIATTIASVALIRRQSLFAALWGYYVVTLIPVLGLVQVGVQAMADRFTYLPSLAPFLLAGLAAARVLDKINALQQGGSLLQACFAAAIAILFVALSALTVKQIAIWKDCNVLWSYVIDEGKVSSSIAYNNRGVCRESAGLSAAAAEDYGKALLLNPRDDQAYYNLGNIYYTSGMIDQAIDLYTRSININAKRADAFYNRGVSYTIKNQQREALADLNKAIELKQDFDMAYFSRGQLYSRIGQRTSAVADYEKACSLGYQAACQELAVRGHL